MIDEKEKNILIELEFERATAFLNEIDTTQIHIKFLTSAHNTYYALYHAICALNITYDLPTPRTHKGLLNKTYIDFVKTGILSPNDNKICIKAETIRNKCDYDGRYKPDKEVIEKNFYEVEKLIEKIRRICKNRQKEVTSNHNFDNKQNETPDEHPKHTKQEIEDWLNKSWGLDKPDEPTKGRTP